MGIAQSMISEYSRKPFYFNLRNPKLSGASGVWLPADDAMAADAGPPGESQTHPALDAAHESRGDLSEAQHFAPPTPESSTAGTERGDTDYSPRSPMPCPRRTHSASSTLPRDDWLPPMHT